jgi:folylpolyglutamate synthase/dihydropteroate synthase
VFAVYKDKDYQTMIDGMKSVVDVWYLPDIGEDRALEPLAIRETLNQLGESDVGTYGKVSEACAAARKNALARSDADSAKDDVVLVFGTFPLVAEALSFFEIPIEGINEHDRSLAVGN